MASAADGDVLSSLAAQMDVQGFVVIPGALSAGEAHALDSVVAQDRAAQPAYWSLSGSEMRLRDPVAGFERIGPVGEGGWHSTVCNASRLDEDDGSDRLENLLSRTTAFDALVSHPLVAALAERLLGPTAAFKNIGVHIRDPIAKPPPAGTDAHWQLWHRDQGGSCLPSHERWILSLQAIFLLTSCTPDSHCFSIVPESLAAKRELPTAPHPRSLQPELRVLADGSVQKMWHNHVPRPQGAVDIHVPAGTAILLNNSNIHAATIRQSLTARRTVHVYWGHRHIMP
jgi:hypothetical protein